MPAAVTHRTWLRRPSLRGAPPLADSLDFGKAELMCCVRVPDENRPAGGW